jgi:tRNA A37 threonylcarbamoyladenosine dehydratase
VTFYEAEASDEILEGGYDYVFDCIDNMKAKLHLLETCVRRDIPVISAMGAGGRLNPLSVRVTDISQTHTDPFARLVRQNLRKRGVDGGFDCVWSDEPPNALDAEAEASFRCICPGRDDNDKHTCDMRLQIQGSVSWMPAIFGLTMAGTAVNRLVAHA